MSHPVYISLMLLSIPNYLSEIRNNSFTEDAVQLWHFYFEDVIAIIDSSSYVEWKWTHTSSHTRTHTNVHTHRHTHKPVYPEMQLWEWMLPLWRVLIPFQILILALPFKDRVKLSLCFHGSRKVFKKNLLTISTETVTSGKPGPHKLCKWLLQDSLFLWLIINRIH